MSLTWKEARREFAFDGSFQQIWVTRTDLNDWQRLLELCALTSTLVIDEDGCYDPADFNDGLLLGLKGVMASAELHFLRARLQGGKLHKAQKGELHFPLPVGFCYDAESRIIQDPDEEVRGAVSLVFRLFRETGYDRVTLVEVGRGMPDESSGTELLRYYKALWTELARA